MKKQERKTKENRRKEEERRTLEVVSLGTGQSAIITCTASEGN
jgi:hypothetical protein